MERKEGVLKDFGIHSEDEFGRYVGASVDMSPGLGLTHSVRAKAFMSDKT